MHDTTSFSNQKRGSEGDREKETKMATTQEKSRQELRLRDERQPEKD